MDVYTVVKVINVIKRVNFGGLVSVKGQFLAFPLKTATDLTTIHCTTMLACDSRFGINCHCKVQDPICELVLA